MKRENPENDGGTKKKMEEEQQPDSGVDELLAALGYKVRSSDMADVAQKLEQLEVAMSAGAATSSTAADEAFISHLASDTVHYNPSELSTWLESMLAEINAPPNPPPKPSDFPQHDLKRAKRMRTAPPSTNPAAVVVPAVDSQETGIQLVHAMMACAEAAQQDNFKAADALVKQISALAASQGGAMGKVAGYFAEALSRRIYRLSPSQKDSSLFSDLLEAHFYESCPYLKFAHFTTNQAILDAFSGCRWVHVIDFGIKQGMQWPALMQALALRPGGPPSFRLTGVGSSDAIQQVGWKLAQFAGSVGVKFEYRGLVASSLADLEPYLFEPPAGEPPAAVAVNSVFEMHRLLAQPGAVERVFATIRAMKPKIVTVVEQESSHNAGSFVERFTAALHYYSTMFDSLEGGGGATAEQQQDRVMSEVYLGRQICNVVACEGADRTERHETLDQWRTRFGRAGLDPVLLGSNAYKQASMLLAFFAGGDGYKVEEREGCLTLGWHNRPLIATSAWRLSGDLIS